MKLIKNTITLIAASMGAAMLAGPAAAVPMSTASLAYSGEINFSLSNGLSVIGDLNAQYRTPPAEPRSYAFNSSLAFGSLSITPVLTVTTPEFVLVPGGETCLPFIGCFETPDISLPSQILPLTPTISLTDPITVYDVSYISPELPAGSIFTTDFATPLLGDALTVDDLVRTQFESGATSVSETGTVVGPLVADYDYNGTLQPDGETILASYLLGVTGPGVLGDLEAALLDIINENTALLSELALDAVLATDPCAGLGIGEGVCNDILNALDPSDLLVTVDSIGNFSTDFSLAKSIVAVPVDVPVPATLPLLVFGVALIGLTSGRRRTVNVA